VRFLVLRSNGSVAASLTRTLLHGETETISTHLTNVYSEDESLNTGVVNEGVINIESLQSGVFCTAKTIDASASFPDGLVLPLYASIRTPARWSSARSPVAELGGAFFKGLAKVKAAPP
jgi:hypothetical protein